MAQADTAKPEPLPAVDAQSPDALVKSYWAQQDWLKRNQKTLGLRLLASDELKAYLRQRIELGTGEFRGRAESDLAQLDDYFVEDSAPTVIQRDIIEVKSESETRAVVLAKIRNVTPLPPNMDLSIWKEDRDYGLDVRYVVERTPAGWRLAQAWTRSPADIKLDKDWETDEPRTGGWKKVWEVPQKDSSEPHAIHYAVVEP